MLAVLALLLTTLEKLTGEQLKTFQSKLNADRQDTVGQMVKKYGPERAVGKTQRILRGMDQNDLAENYVTASKMLLLCKGLQLVTAENQWTVTVQKVKELVAALCSAMDRKFLRMEYNTVLSETTLLDPRFKKLAFSDRRAVDEALQRISAAAAAKCTPSSQPAPPLQGQVEEEQQTSAVWRLFDDRATGDASRRNPTADAIMERSPENFEPEIYDREGKGAYRFQCSITGLVFRMEGEGEVLYRTVPWDRRLLAQRGKRPAGPLFKFTCLKGSVCQLHLPHCEIHSEGGCDFLSVAHVTDDDSTEFLHPHETTETHVILNINGFSKYGISKDKEAPVSPIRASPTEVKSTVTTRTTVQDRILETLEELDKKELNKFQWHLSHLKSVNGFTPIPKSQLKKAERHDTVDKMVQRYGPEETLKISVNILTKMHRNDLSDRLQNNH
ncbi:unnamed protein product [Coregonus sp. 'balchen']|nr:unnamed protein product [Coregonus sp. 'balchen']